jgi:hypothetical protein
MFAKSVNPLHREFDTNLSTLNPLNHYVRLFGVIQKLRFPTLYNLHSPQRARSVLRPVYGPNRRGIVVQLLARATDCTLSAPPSLLFYACSIPGSKAAGA